MRSMLSLAVLASLLSASTGCFTATGALVGATTSRIESDHEVRVARGEASGPYAGNEMRNAVLVGLALDVLTIVAISSSGPQGFGVPDTYPEGNIGR